ncbi:caprin-2-like [Mytilus californianus]|uniref:caprin-2-like n=1 Tax=Mytilus californianus TaxID=6549 RepID=UPI002245EBB3|nr:caprin-2-like [Mytilus californianus]
MHYSILFLLCAFCRSDNVDDLTKRVDVHETEMTRLKSENEMLKDIIKNIMTKITYLEDKINGTVHNKRVITTNPVYVAFHANVAGKISVHDNEVLHFQTVNTNLESAYNGNTGVFESPSQGYYVFFVHFLTYAPKTIEAVIVKNGAPIQNVYAGTRATGGYGTGSNLAIAQLNQGDRIWVKVHDKYHDTVDVLDGPWCTFAGFLLYPTF